MRRVLPVAFLRLLTIATPSCKKARLRAQLMELMGSTIVLPEQISRVYNGEVFPMPDSLWSKAKRIVYIDSSDCIGCRLSRLIQYSSFAELLQSWNASLLVLAAPNNGNKDDTIDLTSGYFHPFPVNLHDNMLYQDISPHYQGSPKALHCLGQ
jgi:hypothetical protein